jgi:predicted DsbA family dithiol-disulfide isomerase
MGIQGVPAFVFNGQFALVGAQEPETLLKALARAETDGPR